MPINSAFSLVEVTITMGIVAFSLMAILGLISVSMMASERASEDTALGLATKKVCTDLSQEGFHAVVTNGASPSTYYFDKDGRDITSDATKISQRLYSCTITMVTPPAAIYTPQPTNNGYLQYLRLTFAWPVTAPVANQRTRTVLTGLANYD